MTQRGPRVAQPIDKPGILDGESKLPHKEPRLDVVQLLSVFGLLTVVLSLTADLGSSSYNKLRLATNFLSRCDICLSCVVPLIIVAFRRT